MKTSDLNFSYPSHLVACEPRFPPRVAYIKNGVSEELSWEEMLERINSEDLVVFNNTRVIPRRLWACRGFSDRVDILFARPREKCVWEVMTHSRKILESLSDWRLPQDVQILEFKTGRPQILRTSSELLDSYFQEFGEMPLPPYILNHRRDSQKEQGPVGGSPQSSWNAQDIVWYQTAFAKVSGSAAAPTAGLHWRNEDLARLRARGVDTAEVTLHVGLGTFLPVTTTDLDDHIMHKELVWVPSETWKKAGRCRGRIWAVGTTVTRALESAALGMLHKSDEGFSGETQLLIQPGYDFKIVRGLMTNFHQPESTLFALVAALAGLECVREVYQWAIEKEFRLFSYGDLSVWEI